MELKTISMPIKAFFYIDFSIETRIPSMFHWMKKNVNSPLLKKNVAHTACGSSQRSRQTSVINIHFTIELDKKTSFPLEKKMFPESALLWIGKFCYALPFLQISCIFLTFLPTIYNRAEDTHLIYRVTKKIWTFVEPLRPIKLMGAISPIVF